MAQEPSSRDLLEAVKQQESGGRRYKADGKTLLEGPMTKYGTAKGEMQVLDMTNKDPGYGVRPAQDNSADERARVGRDYLAAMVKKYGDKKTALVAYNWGPGNTDKWLQKGGDFSKLPEETQNYVTKITGSLGSTKLAQASPTPATKPKSGIQKAVYKAAPLTHPMLSQLGPNYQAAMAVSMLADEGEKEGKSEYEPSEAEKMLTEATARPVALASADLGYQSPFPTPVSSAPAKQQLQAFSHGGVVHRAGGSPETGEYFQDPMGVVDTGPVTADTFVKGKDFKAADALQAVKEVGKGVVRTGKAIAQGVSETPYNVVGAPVDIATMAMRPFGYSTEAPVGGSDWLKKQALEAGIRQAPPTDSRDAGFYTMGELGSSIVNPGPIAAKVGQAAEKAVATGGKTVAREMLRGLEGQGVFAPVSPQDAIMYAVPPDRPFVGRLDEFVDTIKNPVQLGQLKGQLKGKFRDYDLERVERAFTGMDDKAKLTPDQIKQALAGTHSPERWISETRPPEAGKFHQNMDNVWGADLGTTNLYLEQPSEKAIAAQLFEEAAVALGRLGPKSHYDIDSNRWLNAKTFLDNPTIKQFVEPEDIAKLNDKLEKIRPVVTDIENRSDQISNINRGFLWPILYKNPEVAQGATGDQPFFRFTDETSRELRQAAVDQRIAQGMDPHRALMDVLQDDNLSSQISDIAQRTAVQKVHQLAAEDMRKLGIEPPSILNQIDFSTVPMPEGANSAIDIPRNISQFKVDVEGALEPLVQEVHEAQKRIRRFLAHDINVIGESLDKVRPYEGKHKAITTQPYPIGFTRFSEHEATIPGMGTIQGRHFHELQSDLSKDMRATGSTYGSAAKDQAEYDRLNEEVRKLRYQSFPDTGEFSDVNEFNKAQSKWEAAQDSKIQSMDKRIRVLGERIRGNPSYGLEEPFAGFETNQMVRQQLLMKNAIQAAMREGKRFATFPGNESAKPQLYAGKVLPNLRQVIKDLGGEKAGFELRQIELPPDKAGDPITATGVVWSPEAAARIIEKGVPFAKGGSVERLSADSRRYL